MNWFNFIFCNSKFFYLFFFLFSDAGTNDRIVIQDVLKEIAAGQQLDTANQKPFKGLLFVICYF